MFVQVTQIIDPNRKFLVIPSISLQTDIDGEFVYVVEDKHMVGNKLYGVVKQRKIKSRLVANNLTAIQKGFKARRLGNIIWTTEVKRWVKNYSCKCR